MALEPQAPPLSLRQPYAVVSDTLLIERYTDRLADTSYAVEIAQVDLTFPYRGFDGTLKVGAARLYLPNIPEPPAEGLPLAISMHYGMGSGGAAAFVHHGWAILTPTKLSEDHGGNLVGDGLSHSLSMAELGRRLPWVDGTRIAYFGGSAGGYQCLIVAAMRFGAACAWAEVPISDLYYNIRYLVGNDSFNQNIQDSDEWPVPVIHVVRKVGELTGAALGDSLEAWWSYSVAPLVPLLRQPTAIAWCTADILVPVNQGGDAFVRQPEPGTFPEGFAFDYRALGNPLSRGQPLLDVLPADETEVFLVPTPEGAPRVGRIPSLKRNSQGVPTTEPAHPPVQCTPWSREKRFSIIVYEDGPPDPLCNHRKYQVNQVNLPFYLHHTAAGGLPVGAMTEDVLCYLIARWNGQDTTAGPGGARWLTRTDYEPLERWDVLAAQEAYLRSGSNAEARWSALYRKLPAERRVWDVRRTVQGVEVQARADENPRAAIWYHQWELARRDRWDAEARELAERLATTYPASPYAALLRQASENPRQ